VEARNNPPSSLGHGFRGLKYISGKPVAVTGAGRLSLGVT